MTKVRAKLSPTMTLAAFDRGYWYATELAAFADSIGIPSAKKLRKDEVERAVRAFLASGKIASPTKRALAISGERDEEKGLRLDRAIVRYTNSPTTKAFLEREAKKLAPDYRRRSGARYRLNRWREEQLTRGRAITYGDLVRAYVALSRPDAEYARIPHGRYINFVADFLRQEKGATRERAIAAWKQLKTLDVPKDYRSWKRAMTRK